MTHSALLQGGFQGVGWHRMITRFSTPIPYDAFLTNVLPQIEAAPGLDGDQGTLWGVFVQGQKDENGEVIPVAGGAILSPNEEVEQQIASGAVTAYFAVGKFAYFYSEPHGGVVALWAYAYNSDPLAVSQGATLMDAEGNVALFESEIPESGGSSGSMEGMGCHPCLGSFAAAGLSTTQIGVETQSTFASLLASAKSVASSFDAWAKENPNAWRVVWIGSTVLTGGLLALKVRGAVMGLSLFQRAMTTAVSGAKIFPLSAKLLLGVASIGTFASFVAVTNLSAVRAFAGGYAGGAGYGQEGSDTQLFSRIGAAARLGKERLDLAARTMGETIESMQKRFQDTVNAMRTLGLWGGLAFAALALGVLVALTRK